jgi:hypothetical protein
LDPSSSAAHASSGDMAGLCRGGGLGSACGHTDLGRGGLAQFCD